MATNAAGTPSMAQLLAAIESMNRRLSHMEAAQRATSAAAAATAIPSGAAAAAPPHTPPVQHGAEMAAAVSAATATDLRVIAGRPPVTASSVNALSLTANTGVFRTGVAVNGAVTAAAFTVGAVRLDAQFLSQLGEFMASVRNFMEQADILQLKRQVAALDQRVTEGEARLTDLEDAVPPINSELGAVEAFLKEAISDPDAPMMHYTALKNGEILYPPLGFIGREVPLYSTGSYATPGSRTPRTPT